MNKKTFLYRKRADVIPGHWAAYAAAGAAMALVATPSAEADITYSGVIDRHFDGAPGPDGDLGTFALAGPAVFALQHLRRDASNTHIGTALMGMGYAALSSGFVGFTGNFNNELYGYASKLASGQNISSKQFVVVKSLPGYMAVGSGFGNSNSQWLNGGTAFLAFKFNNGGGAQYGWARIKMDGTPDNTFTLIDYAFGDIGDQVTTGEVPEPGSLGLLALGGAGLLAWRRARNARRASV